MSVITLLANLTPAFVQCKKFDQKSADSSFLDCYSVRDFKVLSPAMGLTPDFEKIEVLLLPILSILFLKNLTWLVTTFWPLRLLFLFNTNN